MAGALPDGRLRRGLEGLAGRGELVELALDLGRAPAARFGPTAELAELWGAGEPGLLREELEAAATGLKASGLGLSRLSRLRNREGATVGLTLRVGRPVPGSSDPVGDLFDSGASILLLGPPGAGKTTVLRDACSRMAALGRRVVAVDTRMELGGHADVPHKSLGGARRLPVPDPSKQHRVILEAVLNHSPDVLVVDQISGAAEAAAVRDAAQRGVQLVATAHGKGLENILKDPVLQGLVGGVRSVTLGDAMSRLTAARRKSALERAAPPTFQVAIEMETGQAEWRVHCSVADSVDELLERRPAPVEVRGPGGALIKVRRGHAGPRSSPRAADEAIRFTVGSPTLDLRLEPWSSQSHLFPGAVRPAETRSRMEEALLEEAAEELVAEVPPPAPKLKPRKDAARLLLLGVELGRVQSAISKLQFGRDIRVVGALEEADAVLALRSEFKVDRELQRDAAGRGVPVFTIRSNAGPRIRKALRVLMDTELSEGSLVGEGGGARACASPGRPAPGLGGEGGADGPEAEEEALGLAVKAAILGDGKAFRTACGRLSRGTERALEETRNAVEQIVLKKHMPIELTVQPRARLKAQVRLCEAYDLESTVLSSEKGDRLRVLPDPKLANLLVQGELEGVGEGPHLEAASRQSWVTL